MVAAQQHFTTSALTRSNAADFRPYRAAGDARQKVVAQPQRPPKSPVRSLAPAFASVNEEDRAVSNGTAASEAAAAATPAAAATAPATAAAAAAAAGAVARAPVTGAASSAAEARPVWFKGPAAAGHPATFQPCKTLVIEIIELGGSTRTASRGDKVKVHYAALIGATGCCVDSSRSKAMTPREPAKYTVGKGHVVPGMDVALMALPLGSLARLHMPSRFAYGERGSGAIGPHTDLVFEIEVLSISGEAAPPRDAWSLRELLLLPPPPSMDGTPGTASAATTQEAPPLPDGTRPVWAWQSAGAVAGARATAQRARRLFARSDPEAIGPEAARRCGWWGGGMPPVAAAAAVATGDAGAGADDAAAAAAAAAADEARDDADDARRCRLRGDGVLPRWLTRLHSKLPLPLTEHRSYFDFATALDQIVGGLPHADLAPAGGDDIGPRLVPGARPIRHAPYGTPWDLNPDPTAPHEPLVLTGVRPHWRPSAWGWAYWEREHGDHHVVCKQRAPLFDDDQNASSTLMAECTLREACAYSRTAHLSDGAARGEVPLMYTNGWDVFEAIPSLWDASFDQLPGTIDNMTGREYRRLGKPWHLDDSASVQRRVRRLCKLFVGAAGAVTRVHQDNHNAHAWLCNIRGRKLYVLCRPGDSDKVAPLLSRSKGLGTRAAGRLDPLDPLAQQRALRHGLEMYATVLEEGQTILCPDGWWHYAVSLTPTITLMCNFWDQTNARALERSFYTEVARGIDTVKRDGKGGADGAPPPLAARHGTKGGTLAAPRRYKAVHSPFVYIRSAASTEAEMLGILLPGDALTIGAVWDGWLRTYDPYEKGQFGWVLEDGAALGLPTLMESESEESSEEEEDDDDDASCSGEEAD